MILTALDAAGYLYDAGFRVGQGLVNALATFKGESNFDTDAKNSSGNVPPSIDRGWCQINSYWHPEVTDDCAYDAACAARAAWTLSRKGTSLSSWVVFTSGVYKDHLDEAWAAAIGITQIRKLQADNATVNAQLVKANIDLTRLQQAADDLDGQVDRLNAKIAELTADDASLQAQLVEAKQALQTTQVDLVAAQARVGTVERNVDVYLDGVRAELLG